MAKLERETTTEARLYRAPDVYEESATEKADFYSFALILYEIIAGRPVFDRVPPLETFEQAVGSGARLVIPAEVRSTVKGVDKRGWPKNPSDRWSSFDSILIEWESFQYPIFPGTFWSQASHFSESSQRLRA
jgi:serine/threonine protein kinase